MIVMMNSYNKKISENSHRTVRDVPIVWYGRFLVFLTSYNQYISYNYDDKIMSAIPSYKDFDIASSDEKVRHMEEINLRNYLYVYVDTIYLF